MKNDKIFTLKNADTTFTYGFCVKVNWGINLRPGSEEKRQNLLKNLI